MSDILSQEECDRLFQSLQEQVEEEYEDRMANPEKWEYADAWGWTKKYDEDEYADMLVRVGSFDTKEDALQWIELAKDPNSEINKFLDDIRE